ncbi:unnamed protein product [Schistosoma turkestanicum]|nr:unnamed protein product [Schistosoma turkestanicum]
MTTLAGLKSHDSILSKLDTFKRKRKARLEVEELTKESRQAIEMAIVPLHLSLISPTQQAGNPLDAISEHHMVMQAVLTFINTHLGQVGFHVSDLSKEFRDGVLLILLMGLIEGYFVPFHAYHPTATTEELCLSNVKLAFELIQSAGMIEPPAKPEEIVSGDSNAVLRVLYGIYSYCAHMENEQHHYEANHNTQEQNEYHDDHQTNVS